MYCEKCGTKLQDDAEYCTNCGNKIIGNKEIESKKDEEILLKVKPTFKLAYMILPNLLLYFFMLILVITPVLFVNLSSALTVFLSLFVVLVIVLIIRAFINKKQYENCTYDFYKTKVVYKDRYINLAEKEVKYKYIREVVMVQGVIQKMFKLGSIILYTSAESAANGIYVSNIENVEETYKKIKEIIGV